MQQDRFRFWLVTFIVLAPLAPAVIRAASPYKAEAVAPAYLPEAAEPLAVDAISPANYSIPEDEFEIDIPYRRGHYVSLPNDAFTVPAADSFPVPDDPAPAPDAQPAPAAPAQTAQPSPPLPQSQEQVQYVETIEMVQVCDGRSCRMVPRVVIRAVHASAQQSRYQPVTGLGQAATRCQNPNCPCGPNCVCGPNCGNGCACATFGMLYTEVPLSPGYATQSGYQAASVSGYTYTRSVGRNRLMSRWRGRSGPVARIVGRFRR